MTGNDTYRFIDLEYINDLADGERDFIVNIVNSYLTSVPDMLTSLNEAYDSGDPSKIIFFSHKLKGSLEFIGASQAGSILTQIEAICNEGGQNAILPELVIQVNTISKNIICELEKLLQQMG